MDYVRVNVFRDDVYIDYLDGSKLLIEGARFNIARVASIEADKVFLEIVHSEGEEPYKPEEKITRRQKWLTKYGVHRWPRDRSPRGGRTEEQKERSLVVKEKRRREEPSAPAEKNRAGGNTKMAFLKSAKRAGEAVARSRKKGRQTEGLSSPRM